MPVEECHFLVRDFAEPSDAIDAYLGGRMVAEAVIAVATPIEHDHIRFTNSHWAFSVEGLRRRHGLERLEVINDFVAQALATPQLAAHEVEQIGGTAGALGRPVAVVGPGTGLGVSALIPSGGGWTALPTQGGHLAFAPADAREQAVLECLRQRYMGQKAVVASEWLVRARHRWRQPTGVGNAGETGLDSEGTKRSKKAAFQSE